MTTNDKLADALRDIVNMLRDHPAMQGREYIDLGIAANNALREYAASLAAPPAQGELPNVYDVLLQASINATPKIEAMRASAPQPAPAPVQVDEDCGCCTETTWAGGFEAIEQVQCAKHAQPPAPGERGAQTADDCWRYSPSVPLNPTQNALSILYDLGHDEGRYPEDRHAGKWAQVEAAYAAIAALAQQRIPESVRAVLAELDRATRKFPTWPTDPLHAVAVLGEEAGELTKVVLQAVYEPHKSTPEDVATEAIQTAAMALRFIDSLPRYVYARGEQHSQQEAR